jgi:putative ABC transport system permease protein
MVGLRFAVRSVRKGPGFAAIAGLTLALGVGGATALFSVVYGVLQRPLPYADPASLVLIDGTRRFAGEQREQTFSAREIPDWQRSRTLTSLAGYAELGRALEGRDVLEPVANALVSESFFATLGEPPAAGRWLDPADDRSPVAVISHRLWLRLFQGRPDAIGAVIRLGNQAYSVVGVAAPDFRMPNERVDVWSPMGEARLGGFAPWLNAERGGGVRFVARLRPGVTVAQSAAELRALGRSLAEGRGDTEHAAEPVVTALAEAAAAGVAPALRLLLGAVGLVLLVAAANVANLMLARHAAREREIAVRQALGASRGRLVADVLAEALLVGVAGCAGGIALAVAIVRTLTWWAPPGLPRLDAIRVDGPVLAFAVAVGIAATLLSSLGPALRSARQDAASTLAAGARIAGSARAGRLRSVLIAGEIAISIVLLVGTCVLTRSLVRLLHVDVGARTDDVLVARLDLSLGRTLDETQQRALGAALVARARELPGVTRAAIATALPPNGQMVQLTLKDLATDRAVIAEYAAVAAPASPDLFATLDIPLLEGRAFDERDDLAHGRVVIVSAAVAQDLFGGRALGRTLELPTPHDGNVTATVVGVVGNVKYHGVALATEPALYVPFAQQPWPTAFLLARTAGEPASVAGSLRQAIGSVDRRIGVVSVRPLREVVADETAQPAFQAAVLWSFASASLALAAVGLAGVLGYSVSRRIAEIGVRMALGAGPKDVAWLVLRQALLLGAAGGAVGLAAAAAGTRALAGLVFEVSPGDPASFAAAGTVLALVVLVASAGPAWRASRVDPIAALRSE